MNTYFVMKKVCSFFLLKAQKPLSSTIITNVGEVFGMYYICIHTSNERQIESFIDSLSDVGIVSKIGEVIGDNGEKCYQYEPNMKEPTL